jgi:hypothetical protein
MKVTDWFYAMHARITGRNSINTPVSVITDQLLEKRPLPMGMIEFHEWSNRIIAGACIPGATVESQKFSLAHMATTLQHPFECDGWFINKLRKAATDQTCRAYLDEVQDKARARLKSQAEKTEAEFVSGQINSIGIDAEKPATVSSIREKRAEKKEVAKTDGGI